MNQTEQRSRLTARDPAARVAVQADPGFEALAKAAATRLDLPFDVEGSVLVLHVGAGGWALREAGSRARAVRAADEARSGGGRSLLARALGVKVGEPLHVLDATAGLGRESFEAAALGCRVTACERDPVVALLLRDALDRAGSGLADHVRLEERDAVEVLADAATARPDAVLIDPMFPHGRRGAAKQELRVLQLLLGEPAAGEVDTLFEAALGDASRRVIVKRPRTAPALVRADQPSRRPDARIEGRAFRYDVYLTAGAGGRGDAS